MVKTVIRTTRAAKILDGKKVSEFRAKKLARKISELEKSFKTKAMPRPKLAIIQVGDHPESTTYINRKKIFAEKIGALAEHIKLNSSISQESLISTIRKINADKSVHGIIVQLPLPKNLNSSVVIEAIDPHKDVDGLTSKNIKSLHENRPGLVPATAKGILSLLDYYKISLASKKVVVVGNSVLVGKPIAATMLNRNATVTVCHTGTKNLKNETLQADIIIVAAGHPKLITKNHVKKGQVVIDVGITVIKSKNRLKSGKNKIVGDVDFENVGKIVQAISPVPGGVGPMTIVSLFENLVEACIEADN